MRFDVNDIIFELHQVAIKAEIPMRQAIEIVSNSVEALVTRYDNDELSALKDRQIHRRRTIMEKVRVSFTGELSTVLAEDIRTDPSYNVRANDGHLRRSVMKEIQPTNS